MTGTAELLHFYVSRGHNFVGHHGRPPGQNPTVEAMQLECVAGRGIRGDRYFDHQDNYKGQITFFADEVYEALCLELGVHNRAPSVFRRNVLTRGIPLNSLVGTAFELGGIQFFGTEICRPCHWMNGAFTPGAEAALQNRGGLRARILTSGILGLGPVALVTIPLPEVACTPVA